MRKKKDRTRIPTGTKRQIMLEAGFRCSVSRCPNTHGLDHHHIDGNPSNHDPANLLVLCAVCHRRATSGEIDRKACLIIKEALQMQSLPRSDLEGMESRIIARMEKLVGREEVARPLTEEEKGTRPPDPCTDAAASQAVTFHKAHLPPPVGILRALAHSLYESGEFEGALVIQQLVVYAGDAEAADYSNLGILLSETGRNEEAEEAYRKALEADPKLAQAWFNLGVLLSETGRKDEAEEAYRKALESDPKYAKAWSNLGILLSETGRKEEAEEAYRKAVEADPKGGEAWSNLGFLLSETGRKEEAEEAYRKALEADPGNAYCRNHIAYFLWENGRLDEADAEVREALRLDPDHCYANATLGLLLFEKNDLQGGRKGYERAIELSPDDMSLRQKFHYEYGRALARNSQPEDARRELQAALKVDATYVPREQIEAELKKLG